MSQGAVSPVPHEARPYQGRTAGLVTRVLASSIDAAVVAVVLVAGYAGLNALLFVLDPRGFTFKGASVLFSVAVGLAVLVVYLTAAWATTGRTYGCHVMGLRVVTGGGGRVPVVWAFSRAVLCAVFPVGLMWCAVGRRRRSIQDVLLRTTVVYDWMPSHGPAEETAPITRGG